MLKYDFPFVQYLLTVKRKAAINTLYICMYIRKKIIRNSPEKDRKGQYPDSRAVCYISLLHASRETSQRERTTFGSRYMPALGPSTCPSKIFSSLDSTTRYVYVLSHLFSLPIPGFSNGQFLSSVLGTNSVRVRATLRVSDARSTFYLLRTSVLTDNAKHWIQICVWLGGLNLDEFHERFTSVKRGDGNTQSDIARNIFSNYLGEK